MKKIVLVALLLSAIAINCNTAKACTAAVVAAKASKEGGSILWKNRDSGYHRTCIRYFESEKYAYLGVANIKNSEPRVFAGVNEVGFGIVNTATLNLPKNKEVKGTRDRPTFMSKALAQCSTVDEFEEFVRNYKRGYKFTTNVGVGDAKGHAAFFEIWGDGYRRYDVDKTESGVDFRSSFSFAGDMSKSERCRRRYNAMVEQTAGKKKFSAEDFYNYARSYYVAGKGDALKYDEPLSSIPRETVPFRSTVGSFSIVCGEHPRMLVSMGYPAACPAIPVWVEAKSAIPKCLSGSASHDLGRRFIEKAYTKVANKHYHLNKPLVREALKVKTKLPFPEKMPKDIEKFNRKADQKFYRHQQRIDALLVETR